METKADKPSLSGINPWLEPLTQSWSKDSLVIVVYDIPLISMMSTMLMVYVMATILVMTCMTMIPMVFVMTIAMVSKNYRASANQQ
jgi:hypothetical protein